MSDGLGFTGSDIFIPQSLVAEYLIEDGQTVSGTAFLNFSKKREKRGWKAISLMPVGGGLAVELDDAASELIWLALRNITADWGRSTIDWKEAMVRDPSPDAVIRQGPRRLRRRHSPRPPPPRARRSFGPVTVLHPESAQPVRKCAHQ